MIHVIQSKGKGRPPKRKGTPRENSGRKRKALDEEVSYSTIIRRAHELLEDENINKAVLLKAMQLLEIKDNNQEIEENDEPITTEPHTNESALAFFLENDLTVQSYKNIFKDARSRINGSKTIYPSYHSIEKAKQDCLDGLTITKQTEKVVECTLQSMLNKSAERLIESVGNNWNEDSLSSLELFVSYGFDSSAGHKNPHQEFRNEENETRESHMSLFASVGVLLAIKKQLPKRIYG